MSRNEALILSIVGGLAALLFITIVILLVLPDEVLFPEPTPTITNTPVPTATPTFPNFLPTPSFETPIAPSPSATNTRVPTASPPPSRTPTPVSTGQFALPTPFVRPTATPVPVDTLAPTEAAPTITPVPGRQYTILFEAAKTSIPNGECVDLRWQVTGSVTVQFEGEIVPASGIRKVCPTRDTTYTLTTQLTGTAQVDRKTVRITVN